MNEALKNIGDTLRSVQDRPERSMRFSPVDDGENVALWEDLENVRYKREGRRQDIKLRGGSEEFVGGLWGNANNLVTTYAFETSFEDVSKRFVLGIFDNDEMRVYDVDTGTDNNLGTGFGFNSSTPQQVFVNSRFVYVFDYVTQVAHYIDLVKMNAYEWLSKLPPILGSTSNITTGDITEKNIWGFEEGSSVLVFKNIHNWTTPADPDQWYIDQSETLGPGVYQYDYRGGTYLTINGKDYKSDTIIVLLDEYVYELKGSGDNPNISYNLSTPVVNGEVNFSPQLSKVLSTEVSANPNTVRIQSPWWMEDRYYPDNKNIAIPSTPDLSDLENGSAPYEISGFNIVSNDDFSMPVLYRSYLAVYEFDDGSFSQPSASVTHTVSADNFFDSSNNLIVFGVNLNISSTAPNNAVKLHLFATRWQLDLESTLVPSDKYPNTPFFLQGSYDPDISSIDDYKPDRKLLRSFGSFGFPINNGVPDYFGAGEILPKHISSHKGGILFGGYTINRPAFNVSSVEYDTSGTTTAHSDFELIFNYEYPDNTFGEWMELFPGGVITFEEGADIYLTPPNALVEAIHVYAKDTSVNPATYKKIARVTSSDPPYFGVPITLDAPSNYSDEPLPSGSGDNYNVRLNNYLAFGSPPQMVQISSQKPNESGEAIKGINVLQVDDDRASQIRYQMVLFTNGYPEMCFFDVREQDEDLLFQTDFSPYGLYTGLTTPESIFRYQQQLFFQGYKGLYQVDTNKVRLLVDDDRYDALGNDIISTAPNPNEDEAWFLGDNNRCLVIELTDAGQPTADGGAWSPMVYEMQFPNGSGVKAMNGLTVLEDKILASTDDILLHVDNKSLLADKSFDGTDYDVQGVLTSDHLSGFMQQMYLDVIELLGESYKAQLDVDLQSNRYDEAQNDWSAGFLSDITTGAYPLDMKGTVLEIGSRGMAPRLRMTLTSSAAGRLAGAKLYFKPVEGSRE